MRLKRLSLLILTLLSLTIWSNAQTVDTLRHADVFVLPHGASFTNLTDSTYFAIPRYRLERLMRDAILSDTLQAMALRSLSALEADLQTSQNQKGLWRLGALGASALLLLVALLK